VDREVIVAWLQVLDDLTYYALLGVPRDASPDELKHAFHVFAQTFHPDAHTGRPRDEHEAIGRIFRHGTEGYRVLEDPALRVEYDESLAEGTPASVASRRSSLPPARERAPGPKRLEDTVKSHVARPFARSAEELAKKGDWKQAKLQLSLARNYEPTNEAIAALMREIDAKLQGLKK
jgi:DnaJ-class molecular chaperone